MGVNNEYVWDVTFKSHLGSQAILGVDSLDLKGSLARIFSSRIVRGSAPPFDGPDYQSMTIPNLTSLSAVLNPLKEGIDYYFRVSAINAMGLSDSTYSLPRTQKPHPRPPFEPSAVIIKSQDSDSISVTVGATTFDGGRPISSYRVEYSEEEFKNDKQRIALECFPSPEKQIVTTSALDINEIQYLVLDSTYGGQGIIFEQQRVQCDASGGYF